MGRGGWLLNSFSLWERGGRSAAPWRSGGVKEKDPTDDVRRIFTGLSGGPVATAPRPLPC